MLVLTIRISNSIDRTKKNAIIINKGENPRGDKEGGGSHTSINFTKKLYIYVH